MTKPRLSMKLLWKINSEFQQHWMDTDDGDDVPQFLEYVDSWMKGMASLKEKSATKKSPHHPSK